MKSEMSGIFLFLGNSRLFYVVFVPRSARYKNNIKKTRIPSEKKDSLTYLFSSLTYTYSRYINSYFSVFYKDPGPSLNFENFDQNEKSPISVRKKKNLKSVDKTL